ncbi:sensor histidine kinase [Pseudonocardia saturnea]|uniref:sensor histidine kinase n=1 Tax=Pseudonocardia saturnea TaxID=33909 RepID=UPI001C3FB093|nr:HAMP domain-containing sensor histidine kinase [Pseudonocardia saturnea]
MRLTGAVSLRTRLVASAAGVLLAGLVLTGGATFGALQDWRASQVDDQLRLAAGTVLAALPAAGGPSPLRTVAGEPGPLWTTLVGRGDLPSFLQLRAPDGGPLETVALAPAPAVPGGLEHGAGPVAVTGVDGTPWRVLAVPVPDGTTLVVGQPTAASTELMERTRNVLVGTGLAALLLLTGVATVLVRRGLRPLDRIADAATAIGSGDLTRRVPDGAAPGTEVGRLAAALNAMLARLEEAFTARARSEDRLRRFVADASHELRTPLTTVRGYAELFRHGADRRPDDLAEAMRRIEEEATRMSSLVDELLLLARLDQGPVTERRPVDVAGLAAAALGTARAADPARSWALTVHGPTEVRGDGVQLRRVLDNLLTNVREHTPAGTAAVVTVSGADEAAGGVVLEVADDGPGVPDAERERVLERFHQVGGPAGRPGGGGSGLGLAIVAAVVAAHGGTVRVGAGAGGGCLVRIGLPRTPAGGADRAPGDSAGGGRDQ